MLRCQHQRLIPQRRLITDPICSAQLPSKGCRRPAGHEHNKARVEAPRAFVCSAVVPSRGGWAQLCVWFGLGRA